MLHIRKECERHEYGLNILYDSLFDGISHAGLVLSLRLPLFRPKGWFLYRNFCDNNVYYGRIGRDVMIRFRVRPFWKWSYQRPFLLGGWIGKVSYGIQRVVATREEIEDGFSYTGHIDFKGLEFISGF